jgi:hypothetical protein
MVLQPAMILQHCAVAGRLEPSVRAYRVWPPRAYSEHRVSVTLWFRVPQSLTRYAYVVIPDNCRYLTIEVNGQTVHDSRTDVPCDLAEWEATRHKWANRRKPVWAAR